MPSSELVQGFEERTLEDAIHSPAVAMMRLSLEVDRQLRLILAVIGRLKDYSGQSPDEALDLMQLSMQESGDIPPELRDILQSFWDIRNSVVHGGRSRDGLAMRAVDYGFRILRMLKAIPRPSYLVVTSVYLFTNQAATLLRPDVMGVILASFGPNGESHGQHIHPSRKGYSEGQSVTWEWALNGLQWGETWYKSPQTAEVKFAWSGSLEFVGRPLDEV